MDYDGVKRAVCWSITINNPSQEDFDQVKNTAGHHWFKKFEGQIEKGDTEGTPHIQGMLRTTSVKWSVIKKAFPRAHIEPAKNATALAKYVHKDDTRVSELPETQCATVSTLNNYITKVWDSYESWYKNAKALSEEQGEQMGLWTLDRIVRRIMMDGYYGIEYIGANPSVRATWRKYFLTIMYREYAKTIQVQAVESSPEEVD